MVTDPSVTVVVSLNAEIIPPITVLVVLASSVGVALSFLQPVVAKNAAKQSHIRVLLFFMYEYLINVLFYNVKQGLLLLCDSVETSETAHLTNQISARVLYTCLRNRRVISAILFLVYPNKVQLRYRRGHSNKWPPIPHDHWLR